jgi:hypothetical protein
MHDNEYKTIILHIGTNDLVREDADMQGCWEDGRADRRSEASSGELLFQVSSKGMMVEFHQVK